MPSGALLAGGVSDNNRRFTGETQDPTGLLYLRARYYDPATGRFLTKDPFPGLITNPQTLNPYVYVVNNPVNHTDPSGLQGIGPVGGLSFGDIRALTFSIKMWVDYARLCLQIAAPEAEFLALAWQIPVDVFQASLGAQVWTPTGQLFAQTTKASAATRGATASITARAARSALQSSGVGAVGAAKTASDFKALLGTTSKALGAIGSLIQLGQGGYEAYQLMMGNILPCRRGTEALLSLHGMSAGFKIIAGTAGLVALVAAASNPVGWVALLATGVAIGAGLDAAVYDIGLAKGWWWD